MPRVDPNRFNLFVDGIGYFMQDMPINVVERVYGKLMENPSGRKLEIVESLPDDDYRIIKSSR